MQGGLLCGCGTHRQTPSRPLTAKQFKYKEKQFSKINIPKNQLVTASKNAAYAF